MIKHLILFVFVLLSLASCEQNKAKEVKNDVVILSQPEPYKAAVYSYDSLSIPQFFQAIADNHMADYMEFDSSYLFYCRTFKLDKDDSTNLKSYYTIKILHDLLTSKTSEDCSRGDILNIPYMWHWLDPNPRHEIRMVSTGQLLTEIGPPAEFKRYNSYADIDRTPFLYLSDLVQENPKYYSPSCDTFPTFGWCSEREMAFSALMRTLGFNAKVKAPGIHSWTEIILPMKTVQGKTVYFKTRIDNTYDVFDLEHEVDNVFISEWEHDLGNGTPRWYNRMAFSEGQARRLNACVIPLKAAERIETKLVNYINGSITEK
ncbi:MAG: hypothetical protein DRJ02_01575 [Bacteroidetes bacterium]|nr:MAG: hypothetical protein DRI72_04960 [Bacteroidota bacterium]RLD89361.1 MAG: hypothetical protein DRJ02_01575 [Bacteroidota bacterium]